jgi:hypothetical protein
VTRNSNDCANSSQKRWRPFNNSASSWPFGWIGRQRPYTNGQNARTNG